MTLRLLTLALTAAAFVGFPCTSIALETGEEIYADLLVFEESGPDRKGLRRDTWFFLGYQWITIGLLYAAPESVSGWADEQKENYDLSVWYDNVTHPQLDSDDWYINYIVHPYWGGAYYVRARERGYTDRQAFWYSFLLSCLYEFGAEALFEEVSIQDFFVTPIVGTWVGRYFVRVRKDIRERELELGYRSRRDKWVWSLTDPLGALNEQFGKLTGHEVSMQMRPYVRMSSQDEISTSANLVADLSPEYGFEFHINW
jgi:hypothetical protein